MEETLKELAGDLQVIHQSLERAEVVERQLGKYWREFADERDQLRAEVDSLRKLESAARAGMRQLGDDLEMCRMELAVSRAEVERLTRDFRALDTLAGEQLSAATARAEAAESHVALLRGALEWINRRGGCGLDVHDRIRAALATTPAEAANKVKAEALRGQAAILLNTVRNSAGTYSVAYNSGIADAVVLLRREADRLEDPNGPQAADGGAGAVL